MEELLLIVTVGLPRSGKSTWAMKQGCPVVNPDAIRLALHGDAFNIAAEPMVWAIAQYMVRALFLAGHKVVVLDATNTTEKRRAMWESDAWKTKYKVFDTPVTVCMERASDVLKPIVQKMHDQYEPVEASKCLREQREAGR